MHEKMIETSAAIDPVEVRALAQNPADDDFAIESSCRTVHTHARRLGPEKGRLSSRVMIASHAHGARGSFGGALYTSAEARKFAAALLNLAYEIYGKTPLVFFPEGPSAPRPIEGDD